MSIKDYFESEEYSMLQKAMKDQRDADALSAETFWENLSYEDKCNAFHAVVSKIYKAEIIDQGSYRWALYGVFGFDPDMYTRGMDCGFMALHNSIMLDESEQNHKDQLTFNFEG